MPLRLVIAPDHYSLIEERDGAWAELALLSGGAATLLAPTGALDDRSLEAAIEIAEDWLMPHAARLRDRVLDVDDTTARIHSGLEDVLSVTAREWNVEGIEQLSLQLVDMATGRRARRALQGQQAFVADVLLLRELAHHGQLHEIRLG